MGQNNENGLEAFLSLCMKIKSLKQMRELFDLFFTPEELDALDGRYRIVCALLAAEDSQRTMADKLNVSIAKITRGSNGLKKIDGDLKSFLESECTSS